MTSVPAVVGRYLTVYVMSPLSPTLATADRILAFIHENDRVADRLAHKTNDKQTTGKQANGKQATGRRQGRARP